MPPPKGLKSTATKSRNTERRNGKAFKKNPGVSPKAHNGKTTGGYTPHALARRADIRAVAARTRA